MIPGFNDGTDEIEKIRLFLSDIHYDALELLPYHRLGEHKYTALGMPLTQYSTPSNENMVAFREKLECVSKHNRLKGSE